MPKEEAIEIDGIVQDVLPNTMFRVHLSNGHYVLATIAGKMRRFRIRVLAGDRVTLAVSPYEDRKSTRLNSSHLVISYAVFCLKKKKITSKQQRSLECDADAFICERL